MTHYYWIFVVAFYAAGVAFRAFSFNPSRDKVKTAKADTKAEGEL